MAGLRLAAAALLAATAAPVAAQAVDIALDEGETLLQVDATGEAIVRPDIATFTIGVVTTGATAGEATDANARQVTELLAALRRAGVQSRDMRTRQIGVQPRFAQPPRDAGFDQQQPRIAGYVAQNGITITTRDLAKAPDIVGAAFGAGANSVAGPSLGIEDDDASVAAARTDALARARAEAEAYAGGLGMRIARVLRVSERGRGAQPTEIVVTGARLGAPPPPPPPAPPPPLEAGELRQQVTVAIDYALVPR